MNQNRVRNPLMLDFSLLYHGSVLSLFTVCCVKNEREHTNPPTDPSFLFDE